MYRDDHAIYFSITVQNGWRSTIPGAPCHSFRNPTKCGGPTCELLAMNWPTAQAPPSVMLFLLTKNGRSREIPWCFFPCSLLKVEKLTLFPQKSRELAWSQGNGFFPYYSYKYKTDLKLIYSFKFHVIHNMDDGKSLFLKWDIHLRMVGFHCHASFLEGSFWI